MEEPCIEERTLDRIVELAEKLPATPDGYVSGRITPAVTERCCPKCGHRVTQLMVELIVDDVECPGCKDHTISEFQPVYGG